MDIKEKIFEFIKNNKKIIIICASILFIVTIPVTIILNNNKERQDNKQIVYSDIEKEEPKIIEEEYIYVDIKGMIKNPGIYMMNSKDRVNDVINKAGGLLKGANTRYTNLSKKLTDEMVIVIYSES